MTNIGDIITVVLPVYAEYSIRVPLTQEMIEDDVVNYDEVIDAAYEQLPSGLCHQCSTGNSGAGWGMDSPVYLELGDNPEAQYVMDESGKTVWGDFDAKLGW